MTQNANEAALQRLVAAAIEAERTLQLVGEQVRPWTLQLRIQKLALAIEKYKKVTGTS